MNQVTPEDTPLAKPLGTRSSGLSESVTLPALLVEDDGKTFLTENIPPPERVEQLPGVSSSGTGPNGFSRGWENIPALPLFGKRSCS